MLVYGAQKNATVERVTLHKLLLNNVRFALPREGSIPSSSFVSPPAL